jgi:hypothetical protein
MRAGPRSGLQKGGATMPKRCAINAAHARKGKVYKKWLKASK